MKTTLQQLTIRDLLTGFEWDGADEKGLYGWNGELVIQPEYQRNFVYDEPKQQAVVDSVLKGYPLGLLYFVHDPKRLDKNYEVLDGQQRITSLGRFVKGQFHVVWGGREKFWDNLDATDKDAILGTELLVYVCEGSDSDIREWFQTINIAGVPLTDQELRNAVYAGPYVTAAKQLLSRTKNNTRLEDWLEWLPLNTGDVRRQALMQLAIDWATTADGGDTATRINAHMAAHQHDTDAEPLAKHLDKVIDWAKSLFPSGLPNKKLGHDKQKWQQLWDKYHANTYDPKAFEQRCLDLLGDEEVTKPGGIIEYVLAGESAAAQRLLSLRVFESPTIRTTYTRQTNEAKANGTSNCPDCTKYPEARNDNGTKVWAPTEMEADHIVPWSQGGGTTPANCQMLCKRHNSAKSAH